MKKLILLLFTFGLITSLTAFAQYGSNPRDPDQASPEMTKANKTSAKAVSVSGKIGDDGKTFVDKDGKTWTVSNPHAVKGHEGHEVTVKAHLDADKNEIHVLGLTGKSKTKESAPMSEKPPK
jgi:hypothetical protein